MESVVLKLPEFEGPLELLFALVQKKELDICDLELNKLVGQIVDNGWGSLDLGAESIGHAGSLLWIKSRALLPKSGDESEIIEGPESLSVALLEKLVEYCRFKDAASHLALREIKEQETFFRPTVVPEGLKKKLGIEHVSLVELAAIFQDVLAKSKTNFGTIREEEWRVSDKIQFLREMLKDEAAIPIEQLFSPDQTKLEVIVLFLAILELMKMSAIRVVKSLETKNIVIVAYE